MYFSVHYAINKTTPISAVLTTLVDQRFQVRAQFVHAAVTGSSVAFARSFVFCFDLADKRFRPDQDLFPVIWCETHDFADCRKREFACKARDKITGAIVACSDS